MNIFHAIVLGVVEGVTEFLPISSTAHMMFATRLMGLDPAGFVTSFTIAIQVGAIAAVALVALRRLLADPHLIRVTAIGFIPTALFGFFAYPYVRGLLSGSPLVPIVALAVGGFLLIVFERMQVGKLATGNRLEATTVRQAVLVGIAQCVAFVPGVSRAAATVVGGMASGMTRKAAVELSFLLAIPTMAAATGLDLFEVGFSFSPHEWQLLAVGLVTSFVTALVTVRWLLRYIETHTFASFGLYRIIAAIVLAIVLL
jgi:undecaprenyl-diphosphatase